jgi:ABC-2 type transport system permease protein
MGLIIPSGFEESIKDFVPKQIETYSILNNFSFTGLSKYAKLDSAIAIINETISNQYLAQKIPNLNATLLKNPVQAAPYTVVKNKTAEGSASAVLSYIAGQAYIIPIILFLVIIVSAQMIATSVASEKENKTLETLLTAPISRKTLVMAKMVGAGIVALLFSVIYMLGFRSYISGVSGGTVGTAAGSNLTPILKSLGLVLTPESYVLLGIVIFLGILVALAIAMILGAFAEDVKSVQSIITPLMLLVMIPYFAVILTDTKSLPIIARFFLYAIPFSHVFLAMPNLYLHNYASVIYGAIYELIVFIIFVWIAAWIFSTDKIMTMKLNFKRK